MIVIGLTGSIGMGKSTATDMLVKMGVPVHDSDGIARSITAPGGAALPQIRKIFPEAFDTDDKLNRSVLGQIIFKDDTKRAALESIIHPMVIQSQQDFIRDEAAKGHKVVVLDIPLLYETGAEQRVDKVIVVSAPADVQKARVMARKDMTEEKFQGILAVQMPDHEKRARADYVVDSGVDMPTTELALRKIIETLTHEKKRDNFPPYAR